MSLPDSIAGPWHVLIPINISESHHPLITNFEVFISFTNCYFFFILTVSRTRKEYQNFLKKFNGKNELNVSSIRMKMDEMCFSSLRFVFVFLLFFFLSFFFFHFPKKKQSTSVITPAERAGGARNWRTASFPSIRKDIGVEWSLNRIIQYARPRMSMDGDKERRSMRKEIRRSGRTFGRRGD